MDVTNAAQPSEEILDQIEELQQRAMTDALSGLLNRGALEQLISKRLQDMGPEDVCALFIVDLDNFKSVNDMLGHLAGDEVIRQAARAISYQFRATDIVGRLGGDEFAMFMSGRFSDELVRAKAAAVCAALSLSIEANPPFVLTASVGVHVSTRGESFDRLYHSADLALYKAKRAGKGRYHIKNGDAESSGSSIDHPLVNSALLSMFLNNIGSGVGVAELSDEPMLYYANPNFCCSLGADEEGLDLPRPLTDFVHPDDAVALTEELTRAGEEERPAQLTIRMSAVEEWRWVDLQASRMEGGTLLLTVTDVTGFKTAERKNMERISGLEAALEQTSKQIWEVIVSTGTFRSFARDGKYRSFSGREIKFPEQFIEEGWVHPRSVERFRVFAQELLSGHSLGYGNFFVRIYEEGYTLVSVTYRMLFDELGRPERAVGVLEPLPQGALLHGALSNGPQRLPEGMASDMVLGLHANLDEDRVVTFWEEGTDFSAQIAETRCSALLGLELQNVFDSADRERLAPLFDMGSLRRSYESGQHWLCAEYRRADNGGWIRWVREVIRLYEDPITRQLCLLAYLISIDPGGRVGPFIPGENNRDPVTRLYTRETIEAIAGKMFAQRSDGRRAVVVFGVVGLPEEAALKGRIRYELAACLSLVMGGGCVLGQYGNDTTVVVIPEASGENSLRRRIQEGLEWIHKMLSSEPEYSELRIAVGVVIEPARSANYESMARRAREACFFTPDASSDCINFDRGGADNTWTNMMTAKGEEGYSVYSAGEENRPLSASEQEAAFDGMAAMLGARSLGNSMNGVLAIIGRYYQADRAYILMLVEQGRAVVMTFEWVSPGRHSIMSTMSGVPLRRLPLLEKCLTERAPVSLYRKGSGEGGADPDWHYGAMPLVRGGQIEGFLCIENARVHRGDVPLLGKLIPHMLHERERFQDEPRSDGAVRHLMEVPDIQAYMEALQGLTSANHSSLGVVYIEVPGLTASEVSRGFENNSKLLWYVSKTLTEMFGSSFIFRIWESEFVAFFPDTTREVFLGRCGRLRSILQRRYPKQVMMGRAWGAGDFTARELIKEARAASTALAGGSPAAKSFSLAEDVALRRSAALPPADSFTVYFQPKVDMRTGALVGAEALARGVSDDGTIVLPEQFIRLLEADGIIRELDLLVLERSLGQMERWKLEGLGVVPVSVNLSRVTLENPTTMASILAIQSRFPDVPAEALELEITERGDMLDSGQLKRIVDEYHRCGLRLALDDFGSRYANFPLFTDVKFDTVKLDRSLITGVVTNPISHTLVRDIVTICNNFDMRCVVEGVETEEQAASLLEIGCVYAQGFYYGRPVPVEEFEEKYLRGGLRAPTIEETKEENP